MNYSQHKKYHPEDVLVYIEEYDKDAGIVLFDFFDSNEYSSFTELAGLDYSLNNSSMVLLKNYTNRTIIENTIYTIKRNVIISWREQNVIEENIQNSFLIGYIVEVSIPNEQIFFESISLNDTFDIFLNYNMSGNGKLDSLQFKIKGKLSVIIRNIGQGNWNEINLDAETKVVFDAGASMYASRSEIRNIIGDRAIKYSNDRPGIILSHWDKDHYHSLIGMSDAELTNFSYFICRDKVPNLTSRILFNRISSSVGTQNTYTISAAQRTLNNGQTRLIPLFPLTNQFIIYNGQEHKNRNISGLVVSLKTQKSSVILSGDCHYEQLSRDILPHLNFKHKHNLVVPHHGGKAGNYIYNLPLIVKPEIAVISVGANKYGHPYTRYTKALEQVWSSVIKTNILNRDIIINL